MLVNVFKVTIKMCTSFNGYLFFLNDFDNEQIHCEEQVCIFSNLSYLILL